MLFYSPINLANSKFTSDALMSEGACGKAAYFTESPKFAFEHGRARRLLVIGEFIANYEKQRVFDKKAGVTDSLFRDVDGTAEVFAVTN
jgi:hypothetical protein